jgi:glycosyltransferase involved in cell wall biosynthesis
VVIFQYRLLHYRLVLFELLRRHLQDFGIELILVHGQASQRELARKDEGELPWAHRVANTFLSIGGKDILWQPLPAAARGADLYITMQENRILSNYPLLLKRRLGGPLVAYWGHGRNLQSTAPSGLRERWKRWIIGAVDWWFAYTDLTVSYLQECGFPLDRVTNLENAIDVQGFRRDLESVNEAECAVARERLGIPLGARIGLFCGSLYPEKRLDLLLSSADRIKAAVPEFHLVVIGDGPSAAEIKAAEAVYPWIHWVGVKKGHEKAVLFRMAHVQMNPGLVGLHVLDAFSAGLPMVTTSTAMHSPEIAYLRNGDNGVIVEGDMAERYADAITDLLTQEQKRAAMSDRCLQAAARYTVENMARRFADGIIQCLQVNGRSVPSTNRLAT